jgi:hypothetical protein
MHNTSKYGKGLVFFDFPASLALSTSQHTAAHTHLHKATATIAAVGIHTGIGAVIPQLMQNEATAEHTAGAVQSDQIDFEPAAGVAIGVLGDVGQVTDVSAARVALMRPAVRVEVRTGHRTVHRSDVTVLSAHRTTVKGGRV